MLLVFFFPSTSFAQVDSPQGAQQTCPCPMGEMMGGMGMHGPGWTILAVLTVILILALIAVLVAFTIYLIRKSR